MHLRSLSFLVVGSSLFVGGCPTDAPLDPTDSTSDGTTGGSPSTSTESGGTTEDPGLSGSESEGGAPSTGAESSDGGDSTGAGTTCGDAVVQADEACDGTDLLGATCLSLGFEAGELACAEDCSSLDQSDCHFFNCGNDTTEGREACDGTDLQGATCLSLGFDSGTLGCNNTCTALDTSDCGTCGNVIVDGDEACDDIVLFGQSCQSLGYDSGQLACQPDCLSYDETGCGTCGNMIIDGAEGCDTGSLGGATCLTQGFDSGTIACDDATCALDTAGCGQCGNGIVDGDEECDDGNTGTQCLPGCVFCPGGVIFEETFADNMAGWTLDTEWEIGPAVMSPAPGSCGAGDPEFDHTPTGDNGIAGVVIGGNASTGLHSFYHLTSPPIDTVGYSFLELDLWRWLNSDYTPFMQNHIEVWDGAAWQTIWESGPPPGIQDAAWTNVAYDIAAYANPALQVRIGFNIDSAGVFTCSQWNVDDLRIVGVTCP